MRAGHRLHRLRAAGLLASLSATAPAAATLTQPAAALAQPAAALALAAAALALALVAPIPATIFADIDRGFLRVD